MFEPEDWASIFEAGEYAARTPSSEISASEALANALQAMKDKANELAEYYYEEDDDERRNHQHGQGSARSALPGPGH